MGISHACSSLPIIPAASAARLNGGSVPNCNRLDLVEKTEQFMLPTGRTPAPDATFLSSVLTSTDHVLGNRRLYYD
jgi:hypothetical protein